MSYHCVNIYAIVNAQGFFLSNARVGINLSLKNFEVILDSYLLGSTCMMFCNVLHLLVVKIIM